MNIRLAVRACILVSGLVTTFSARGAVNVVTRPITRMHALTASRIFIFAPDLSSAVYGNNGLSHTCHRCFNGFDACGLNVSWPCCDSQLANGGREGTIKYQ